MDTSSILWGTVTLTVCLVPLLLLGKQIKKASRKLLIPILEEAKNNNGVISVHEMISDVCFALDEKQNTLYYYRNTKEIEELESFNLNEIENSKIEIIRKSENRKSNAAIVKVFLELHFKTSAIKKLVIFDLQESTQLIPEVLFAEKWNRIINSKI